MKKGLFLVVSLALLSSGARAQTNFRPGYVVPLGGDTLRGEVDSRGAQRNARLSRFRPTPTGAITEYRPAQLRGFGFTNDRVYQTGVVALADSAKPGIGLQVKMDTVRKASFLEVLVLGPASLLYLRDLNNKDHYYLRMGAAGEPQELISTPVTKIINGTTFQQPSDEYKRTLAAATRSCLAVQPQINGLRYNEQSLMAVVQRYNECTGGMSVAPAAARRRNYVRLGLVAGGQKSRLDFFNQRSNRSVASNSASPVAGLALQMSFAGLNEAISGRLEALYNDQSYEDEFDFASGLATGHEQIRVHLRSIHIPLLVRYTFPRGTIRPFAQAGYSASIFMKTDNEFRDRFTTGSIVSNYGEWQPIVLIGRKFEAGFTGGLGLTTARPQGRNLALELRYARTNGFSEQEGIESRIHRFMLLLSYDLTK